MELGAVLSPSGAAGPAPSLGWRWEAILAQARRAEAAGLASVWLGDGPPDPGAGPALGPLDPLVGLAALTRATATITLGTLLWAPLRPPVVLAKALATLDRLSGQRLVVSLGPGPATGCAEVGLEAESAERRRARLADTVAIVRGLDEGGPLRLRGRVLAVDGARNRPPPGPGRPPLWIGGGAAVDDLVAPVPERAPGASHAGGWGPIRVSGVDGYRRAAAALHGGARPGAPAAVAVLTEAGGDVAELAARLRGWAEAGAAAVVARGDLDILVEAGRLAGVCPASEPPSSSSSCS